MQTEIRASLNSFLVSLVLLWRREVVLGEVPLWPVPKVKKAKGQLNSESFFDLLTLGTGKNGTSPRTTSWRHSSTSEMKKELRLARISVCIVWLFLFCHVWKLVPTHGEKGTTRQCKLRSTPVSTLFWSHWCCYDVERLFLVRFHFGQSLKLKGIAI